eukprot:COSAG06_NODE_1327_length_9855_cov_3.900574_8_plen_252_part_00
MLVLLLLLTHYYHAQLCCAGALAVTPRITARWGSCGRAIDRGLAPIIRCHDHIFSDADAACGRIFQLYLALLSLPMFIAGTWLGVLVIVGQGKKKGHLNFFTALILLFDVGFKIGATIFCEVYDLWFVPWRQRRRQRAAEERRALQAAAVDGGGGGLAIEGRERERELAPVVDTETRRELTPPSTPAASAAAAADTTQQQGGADDAAADPDPPPPPPDAAADDADDAAPAAAAAGSGGGDDDDDDGAVENV